jgi:uncharacterized protein YlxP (DUF503 family)
MAHARRPASDVSVFVALLSVEVFLPDALSLKDNRMSMRRVKDRLKAQGVAVAEVGYVDLWQRAALGVVAIGNTRTHVDAVLTTALTTIETYVDGDVTSVQTEFLT